MARANFKKYTDITNPLVSEQSRSGAGEPCPGYSTRSTYHAAVLCCEQEARSSMSFEDIDPNLMLLV